MDDISLAATRHTPQVDFAFSSHRLSLSGEVYPENAVVFFRPLLDALRAYLDRGESNPLSVVFHLLYMNSASTKMIFQLVALLDGAALAGRTVELEFLHDPEDDMALELGQEFAESFPSVAVRLVETA